MTKWLEELRYRRGFRKCWNCGAWVQRIGTSLMGHGYLRECRCGQRWHTLPDDLAEWADYQKEWDEWIRAELADECKCGMCCLGSEGESYKIQNRSVSK